MYVKKITFVSHDKQDQTYKTSSVTAGVTPTMSCFDVFVSFFLRHNVDTPILRN